MRKVFRDRIVSLLETILESVQYVSTASQEQTSFLLSDAYTCICIVEENLIKELSEKKIQIYLPLFAQAKDLLERLSKSIPMEKLDNLIVKETNQTIIKIKSKLNYEKEITYKILFLPYKYSMWDCMESVYFAAIEQGIECTVMPIPYYDFDENRNVVEKHYEGNMFSQNVSITYYEEYDIEQDHPEVIIIHNPYDQSNFVTSVHPAFFSDKLKNYTDLLIYIAYGISGIFRDDNSAHNWCNYPAFHNADAIVMQSPAQKQLFAELGYPNYKLWETGNPKFDAALLNNAQVPEKWEGLRKNRKVLLINTALTTMLGYGSDIERAFRWVMDLTKRQDVLLIWRPHPLIEVAIRTMRSHCVEQFQEIKGIICSKENVIYDQNPDVYPAFKFSDALLSDYSSLMMQYAITGKPVFTVKGSKATRKSENRLRMFDYSKIYFNDAGVRINDFVDMIIEGRDDMHDERMQSIADSIYQMQPIAGKKIVSKIINNLKG